MFCPFCKAEYRPGFTQCSDCAFALTEKVPKDSADPNFMVILWNGENLDYHNALCGRLEEKSIRFAATRIEVLLRDTFDRYHLRHTPTFPYVIGVLKHDFPAARTALIALAREKFPLVPMPQENAYPEPFDESRRGSRSLEMNSADYRSVLLWASDDLNKIEFLESALSGLDIAWRRLAAENGNFQIMVRAQDERLARGILQDIVEGPASRAQLPEEEKGLWQDNPPRSYFLAWFLAAFYFVISFFVFASFDLGGDRPKLLVASVLSLAVGLDTIGKFWMMYQAIRYEMRSFRYCLMTLVPLTWVWYYVERYQARKGPEKLPLAVRLQERPPLT